MNDLILKMSSNQILENSKLFFNFNVESYFIGNLKYSS
jgi:hypothetical protein